MTKPHPQIDRTTTTTAAIGKKHQSRTISPFSCYSPQLSLFHFSYLCYTLHSLSNPNSSRSTNIFSLSLSFTVFHQPSMADGHQLHPGQPQLHGLKASTLNHVSPAERLTLHRQSRPGTHVVHELHV
ncbi:hypothetical protein Patl1_37153 [Pistacia atlantica]|nr:hypothetical protein Patl1_37153 [Pistacia atlantica]